MQQERIESGKVRQDDTHYISVREAAEALGKNRRAVRTLVSRGQLETKETGSLAKPEISLSSVEKLLFERRWERESGQNSRKH